MVEPPWKPHPNTVMEIPDKEWAEWLKVYEAWGGWQKRFMDYEPSEDPW